MQRGHRSPPAERRPQPKSRQSRRAYSAPAVRVLGDIRDVTMGPTPGIGESGGAFVFKP